MLSRAVVVTMIGTFRPWPLWPAHHVMLELSRRIVANPGHEADLVVDEDERRVFRRQRFIGRVGSDMTVSCRKER